MKEDALTGPLLWNLEGPSVPQPVDVFQDTRQGRFNRKRDENGAAEFLPEGWRVLLCCFGKLPKAVQVHPLGADHLRARVFRERIFGIDILCPLRQERGIRWDFPAALLWDGQGRKKKEGNNQKDRDGFHGRDPSKRGRWKCRKRNEG